MMEARKISLRDLKVPYTLTHSGPTPLANALGEWAWGKNLCEEHIKISAKLNFGKFSTWYTRHKRRKLFSLNKALRDFKMISYFLQFTCWVAQCMGDVTSGWWEFVTHRCYMKGTHRHDSDLGSSPKMCFTVPITLHDLSKACRTSKCILEQQQQGKVIAYKWDFQVLYWQLSFHVTSTRQTNMSWGAWTWFEHFQGIPGPWRTKCRNWYFEAYHVPSCMFPCPKSFDSFETLDWNLQTVKAST